MAFSCIFYLRKYGQNNQILTAYLSENKTDFIKIKVMFPKLQEHRLNTAGN